MATSTSWGYTNASPATNLSIPPVVLGRDTNYGVVQDDAEICRTTNRTSPLNQPEKITYRCAQQKIQRKDLAYPGPSDAGVIYSVRVDDILRVTDPAGSGSDTVIDEPISMWLTVKHSTSNNWTNSTVSQVLTRLLGALATGTSSTSQSSSGVSYVFEDLMRSALKPNAD